MTRLLGIHSGAMGDVVLFARLLDRLRQPGEAVALAAGGEKAALLAELGVVDQAIDFTSLPMHELFLPGDPRAGELPGRLGQSDRLVSCFGQGDQALEARLTHIAGADWARFLPIRPPAEAPIHLLDFWADLIGLSGAAPAGPRAWPVSEAIRHEARTVLAQLGLAADQPFVAIHPGAGSPAKCWPIERYAELLARLGWPALVILGPVELERWGASATRRSLPGVAMLVNPSLRCLAGVLAAARAYVGNDSGPSHLAAAVGTPTLGLFGPTRPEQFAPVGPHVRTLRGEPIESLDPRRVAQLLQPWLERP